MVENYRYDGIPVGTLEDLAEMQSCGEWFEPGEGLQGLEPKRPKIDIHTNVPRATSPLGLTLTKTPSFVELIETKLSKHGEQKMRKGKAQSPPEKLKASSIPTLSLQIGFWKRVALYDGDLVAKCYFAKQKLVWEVLCEGLKSKMEIQWLQISAIRATFVEGHPDCLEIELQKPPTYFCESSPQPRKHTMWFAGNDFTGGQAQIFKRHILQFAEGTLEKLYEKLLQCDSRLHELSRRSFPNPSSPFFDIISIDPQIQPLVVDSHNISNPSQQFAPYRSISPSVDSINSIYPLPRSTAAIDPMGSYSARNFHPIRIHEIPAWNQGVVQDMRDLGTRPTFEINSLAHQLLSEPQSPSYADEKSLLVKVSSFGSVLNELNAGVQVGSTIDEERYNNVLPELYYGQIKDCSDPSSSSMALRSEGYMFRPS